MSPNPLDGEEAFVSWCTTLIHGALCYFSAGRRNCHSDANWNLLPYVRVSNPVAIAAKSQKWDPLVGVYSYSVGVRCLLCWGVIGLFVTDCAIPMDSLFPVLGGFRPANLKGKM